MCCQSATPRLPPKLWQPLASSNLHRCSDDGPTRSSITSTAESLILLEQLRANLWLHHADKGDFAFHIRPEVRPATAVLLLQPLASGMVQNRPQAAHLSARHRRLLIDHQPRHLLR